jgi:hypothetical protein
MWLRWVEIRRGNTPPAILRKKGPIQWVFAKRCGSVRALGRGRKCFCTPALCAYARGTHKTPAKGHIFAPPYAGGNSISALLQSQNGGTPPKTPANTRYRTLAHCSTPNVGFCRGFAYGGNRQPPRCAIGPTQKGPFCRQKICTGCGKSPANACCTHGNARTHTRGQQHRLAPAAAVARNAPAA